jgi:hypothetical protein
MWTCTIIALILLVIVRLIIFFKNKNNNKSFDIFLLILTIVLVAQTEYVYELTLNDVPNFPTKKYSTDIVRTYGYIDSRFSNNLIYEVDYLVKYSKMNPPKSYNVSIFLPIEADGFISVEESRGFELDYWVDAQNDRVEIINENEINPLLLHFVYVSEKNIDHKRLIIDVPLPDFNNDLVSNDSFFVKIKNIGKYDIQTLNHCSNVNGWINSYLIQLDNFSWVDQPIMIYDNDLPIRETIIDNEGNISWEINSLNSGEHKVYYFKKIDESTRKQE